MSRLNFQFKLGGPTGRKTQKAVQSLLDEAAMRMQNPKYTAREFLLSAVRRGVNKDPRVIEYAKLIELKEKQQGQQQLGQASSKALGAQFEEQAPSSQLQGALGAQAPAQPAPPPHQTPGGAADREASLQPRGGPMRGGPSMVTQGEAQTRPEAQQRVGAALGELGAAPQETKQYQAVAGLGLPETPPSPDDALMSDVETKGGMSSGLGINTYLAGKKEQLASAENKAKSVQKVLDKVLKDPQILADPKKRQKIVAEAKPLGLWDDEVGLASKEEMLEIITAAEEHAESLKGEVGGAEEQKKQAVLGKQKQPAAPAPATAENRVSIILKRELENVFPDDVILSEDIYGRVQKTVKPNTNAAKIAGNLELRNAFIYLMSSQNAQAAGISRPSEEATKMVEQMMAERQAAPAPAPAAATAQPSARPPLSNFAR